MNYAQERSGLLCSACAASRFWTPLGLGSTRCKAYKSMKTVSIHENQSTALCSELVELHPVRSLAHIMVKSREVKRRNATIAHSKPHCAQPASVTGEECSPPGLDCIIRSEKVIATPATGANNFDQSMHRT
mmetsp:Transcript_117398/g.204010  ORF Transcript_117398/g.204010 Transcript_117398/m.204010 type:complete len:131 (+) Transcript_117398:264-656(+)